MATVRNIESVTVTTDANGDVLNYDVTNGAHWNVLGVLASPDDAFGVIVRPSPGANQYSYNFRVFKRNADGTISALASTQVRFIIAACG